MVNFAVRNMIQAFVSIDSDVAYHIVGIEPSYE